MIDWAMRCNQEGMAKQAMKTKRLALRASGS
jgi:hypothetical protein